jgi:peptidoglycan/xylan/chitin deacetylase (PgdA/CDA1 family)
MYIDGPDKPARPRGTQEMKVTLSFDNGPEPDVTPQVLEVLSHWGVQAIFFVLGHKLEEPDRLALAQRAHREGHRIGNHTFSHSIPFGELKDPHAAEEEISRTQALIGPLSDDDRLFRPFGGGMLNPTLLNRPAIECLVRGRYTVALWNCVPRDWEEPQGWPLRALHECRNQQWSVVVLHDLPTGAMNQLDRFLAMLHEEGASFSQDLPQELTPLRRGQLIADLTPYSQ